MIVIVDFGMGNLGSIANMLKKLRVEAVITSDPMRIEQAEKLILPGVGAFDNAMKHIHEAGFKEILDHKAFSTPITNSTPMSTPPSKPTIPAWQISSSSIRGQN